VALSSAGQSTNAGVLKEQQASPELANLSCRPSIACIVADRRQPSEGIAGPRATSAFICLTSR